MQPNWLRYLPPFIRAKLSSSDVQKVVGNTGWLFADKFIKAGGELTIGLWMARYLGPQNFGLLNYAIAFISVFSAPASLGLHKIAVRDMVQQPTCRDEILGTALILRLSTGLLLGIAALISIVYLRPNDKVVHWIVGVSAAGLLFQSADVISYWFQSQMQARSDVMARSSAYMITNIARISLILGKAKVLSFGLLPFLEIVLRCVNLTVIYRRLGCSLNQWKFSFDRARVLSKASWPLVLSGIAVTIYMRIDQVMIGQMLSDDAVGIYSAAVKLSEAWYFMPMAIASSSFPMLLRSKEYDSERYKKQLHDLFRITLRLTYFIVIPTSLLANPIMTLLLGQGYSLAGSVLSIHIWSGLFVSLGAIRELWMAAEGLTQFSFLTTTSGAIINILINYFLIPISGINGAAIATLISYGFAIFLACFIHPKTRYIAKVMASSLILIKV